MCTLSFPSVMALFAKGNMLLEIRRARLPRSERASWPGVIVAVPGTPGDRSPHRISELVGARVIL